MAGVTDPLYLWIEPGRPDIDEGMRARVADPVWFLARQWQLGEQRGEDASSPVVIDVTPSHVPITYDRTRPDLEPTVVPAEALLEAEPGDWWTVGRRIRLGRAAAPLLDPSNRSNFSFGTLAAPYDHLGGEVDGRAVFVSTTAVTTALPAPSKRIRLAAERQIRNSRLQWTIIRPTMIYGAARDRNLSRLLRVLSRTRVLPVPGGGRHLQQPVHVADVADAVLAAAERPGAAGSCYDVAGPEPLAFAELLRISARAVASRTRFVPVPLTPLVAVARGYEQLSGRPRIRAEQLRRLAEDKAFVIKDAERDLGYAPRQFPAGIRAEAEAMGLAR